MLITQIQTRIQTRMQATLQTRTQATLQIRMQAILQTRILPTQIQITTKNGYKREPQGSFLYAQDCPVNQKFSVDT